MSQTTTRRGRSTRRAAGLSAAVVLACAGPANAGNWIGPLGGLWSNPANWSDGVVPPEGGTASIAARDVFSGGPTQVNVLFDAFYANPVNVALSASGSSASMVSLSVNQNAPGSQLITPGLSFNGTRGSISWNQSAGTAVVQNGLSISPGAGNVFSAGYTLGGSGALTAGTIAVGSISPTSSGFFSQTGGTLSAAAVEVNANGSYSTSGGSADVGGNVIVRGAATFGGNTSIAGDLEADGIDIGGSITMSGGTLNVGGALRLNLGGSFNQTGGSLRADSALIEIGSFNGTLTGAATVDLSLGARFTQVGAPLDGLQLFRLGPGATFFVGGLSSADTVEFLGGTFSLSNSTLTAMNYRQAVGTFDGTLLGADVFELSGGAFTQNGPALTPTSFQETGGTFTGSVVGSATFELSGGTFNQTGVPVQLPGPFRLNGGNFFGAIQSASSVELITGDANITGGTLTTASYSQAVGRFNAALSGVATFQLSGGSFTPSAGVISPNRFEQLGGLFSGAVSGTDTFTLGGGTFNQTGGSIDPDTFTQSGGAFTGVVASAGSFSLTGGSFAQNVGSFTVTSFRQSGASTFNGHVSSAGSFLLQAGAHTMPAGAVMNVGTFAQSGGTFTGTVVPTNFSFTGGAFAQATGTLALDQFTLAAGTFSAHLVTPHLTITGGRFTQTGGGTIALDSFAQSGGTFVGTVDVRPGGSFTYGGGTFAGSLRNRGAATINVNFSPAGSVTNDAGAMITLAAGRSLLAGGAIDNAGTIALGGGTLGGASIINSGTISGSGRIQAASTLTNGPSGTVLARLGNLTIPAGAALVSDGTLGNAAGANLFVESANVTRVGNLVVNASGATVFNVPVAIDAGRTANLLGGTLDAPQLTVAAGGTLRGFGVLAAPLTSAGSTDFFGQTSVLGNVTNQASAAMLVRNNQTLVVGGLVNHGTVTIASGGDLAVDQTLTVAPSGIVRFNAGSFSAAALDIVGGGGRFVFGPGADKVARTRALAIGDGGKLDLGEGAAVVDYSGATSPLPAIRAYVVSAYDGGAWTGDGIGSAFADATTRGVGYAEFTDLGSAPPIFGSVDETSVLLRLTRYGDADLDGAVDLQDFNRLASNFGSSGAVWSRGDFTYDGVVNLADFNRLAINFGLSAAGPDVTPQDWANLAAAVPEPAIGVAPILASILARRRRRRNLRG